MSIMEIPGIGSSIWYDAVLTDIDLQNGLLAVSHQNEVKCLPISRVRLVVPGTSEFCPRIGDLVEARVICPNSPPGWASATVVETVGSYSTVLFEGTTLPSTVNKEGIRQAVEITENRNLEKLISSLLFQKFQIPVEVAAWFDAAESNYKRIQNLVVNAGCLMLPIVRTQIGDETVSTLPVYGSPNGLAKVRNFLQNRPQLRPPTTRVAPQKQPEREFLLRFMIRTQDAGFMIGTRGARVKRINETFNVNIFVEKDTEDNKSTVRIAGDDMESVTGARKEFEIQSMHYMLDHEYFTDISTGKEWYIIARLGLDAGVCSLKLIGNGIRIWGSEEANEKVWKLLDSHFESRYVLDI